jgi:hypothetical protein
MSRIDVPEPTSESRDRLLEGGTDHLQRGDVEALGPADQGSIREYSSFVRSFRETAGTVHVVGRLAARGLGIGIDAVPDRAAHSLSACGPRGRETDQAGQQPNERESVDTSWRNGTSRRRCQLVGVSAHSRSAASTSVWSRLAKQSRSTVSDAVVYRNGDSGMAARPCVRTSRRAKSASPSRVSAE